MKTMEMTWTSRPGSALVTHNERLANPLEPITRELALLTKKQKKTEEDHWRVARVEFEGGLYMDDKNGPVIPGVNVLACLRDGARMTKEGKNVERFVVPAAAQFRLDYDGPRDVEGLWKKGFWLLSTVPVGKGRRVLRCRPRWNEWSARVSVMFDDNNIKPESMAQIADNASMLGLGERYSYRGRFDVKDVKIT